MKTIKQWFESVKDEKLRNELLENMEKHFSDSKVSSIKEAIYLGLDNQKPKNIVLLEKIYNNEIETL
ncbi:MAG TPA: hypothetical protein VGF79_00975 [Bacteroidia bacterium]